MVALGDPLAGIVAGAEPRREREPILAGFLETRRPGGARARIPITYAESILIGEALMFFSDNYEEATRRWEKRSGRPARTPQRNRRMARSLFGFLIEGVIFDSDDIRAWRIAHGASPSCVRRFDPAQRRDRRPSK